MESSVRRCFYLYKCDTNLTCRLFLIDFNLDINLKKLN